MQRSRVVGQTSRKKTYKKKAVNAARAKSVRIAEPTAKVSGYGPYRRRKYQSSSSGIGRKIGGFIGEMGEKALTVAIPKILGFGDYAMPAFVPKQNTLMQSMVGNDPPVIQNSNVGVIVKHREYLGDVISGATSAFNVFGNYPINPGLDFTFPWLSSIAQNYQEWRPRGILFEFKSTSADSLNSTNTALGTVIMATQYDSSKGPSPFVNKQQMENHEFASSARQSCSMIHPIECAMDRNPLSVFYTRFGNEPSNFDIRNADLGIFSIATVGQQGANVNIGELWVTYEIEFLKPQLIAPLGQNLLSYKASNNTSISTAAYFGNLATLSVRAGSLLPITLTANQIQFPIQITEGSFYITYFVRGSSTAGITTPSFALTNCSIVQCWLLDTASVASTGAGDTSSNFVTSFIVNITGASAVIQFSSGVLPASITSMDIAINQWNSSIQT